jgi:hypothetical protein
MQLGFGSGVLWGTPTFDANANAIANPTPIKFGTMQDVSIDFAYDLKELYGQLQLPVDIARGKAKIQGKAKIAQINGLTFNSLFFGQTLTVGSQVADFLDTTGTAVPTTPFQITPTVPSSGTWAYDLGVVDVNGIPFTRVASAPATNQYTVAAGVYTFAAADVARVVYISYNYTFSSGATRSTKSTINNLVMGAAPSFQGDFMMVKGGKQLQLTLLSCVATKLTMPTKIDDYLISELDFSAFAAGVGSLGSWSMAE